MSSPVVPGPREVSINKAGLSSPAHPARRPLCLARLWLADSARKSLGIRLPWVVQPSSQAVPVPQVMFVCLYVWDYGDEDSHMMLQSHTKPHRHKDSELHVLQQVLEDQMI